MLALVWFRLSLWMRTCFLLHLMLSSIYMKQELLHVTSPSSLTLYCPPLGDVIDILLTVVVYSVHQSTLFSVQGQRCGSEPDMTQQHSLHRSQGNTTQTADLKNYFYRKMFCFYLTNVIFVLFHADFTTPKHPGKNVYITLSLNTGRSTHCWFQCFTLISLWWTCKHCDKTILNKIPRTYKLYIFHITFLIIHYFFLQNLSWRNQSHPPSSVPNRNR